MNKSKTKSIIEALLFVSGNPLSFQKLQSILDVPKKVLKELLSDLVDEYQIAERGFLIVEKSGGFQMVTNPHFAEWVEKLTLITGSPKLTQKSLETLAVVAYKQPITKAEIEAIRGVNSGSMIKTLLEKRLIKILGRKLVPGRPLLYGTTKEFLDYFGVKSIAELPTIKEFDADE